MLTSLLNSPAFSSRRQKAVTVDPMVFACVAMMSRAIGPKISKEVKDLLEPMLSVGLRYIYSVLLQYKVILSQLCTKK